ncbi:hypothetical protein D3C73_844480 [compost metagenome]
MRFAGHISLLREHIQNTRNICLVLEGFGGNLTLNDSRLRIQHIQHGPLLEGQIVALLHKNGQHPALDQHLALDDLEPDQLCIIKSVRHNLTVLNMLSQL